MNSCGAASLANGVGGAVSGKRYSPVVHVLLQQWPLRLRSGGRGEEQSAAALQRVVAEEVDEEVDAVVHCQPGVGGVQSTRSRPAQEIYLRAHPHDGEAVVDLGDMGAEGGGRSLGDAGDGVRVVVGAEVEVEVRSAL